MTPDPKSDTATLDWEIATMAGNDASILSQQYMQTILTGLNGGDPVTPDSSQDPLITSGLFKNFHIM